MGYTWATLLKGSMSQTWNSIVRFLQRAQIFIPLSTIIQTTEGMLEATEL